MESPEDAAGGGRCRARRWLDTFAVFALVVAVGYGGWTLVQHHQREVAGQQALAAAEKYALTLSNIDSGVVDDTFDALEAGATGEFQNMHVNSREHLRGAIMEHIATTRGTIVDSAVKSATPTKAVVVLLVDQSIRNGENPDPVIDRSRLRMTMQKVDGRWLASKVELL